MGHETKDANPVKGTKIYIDTLRSGREPMKMVPTKDGRPPTQMVPIPEKSSPASKPAPTAPAPSPPSKD